MGAFEERIASDTVQRAVYTYTIPEALSEDIKTIGLVELTAHEELQCAKRARGEQFNLAYELAKQSLIMVNGEKVSIVDGSADKVWNRMPPKVRNLILTAYSELHTPPDGAVEGFMKSRTVQV